MKISRPIRIKVAKRAIKRIKRLLPKVKDPDTFFRMTNQYDSLFIDLYKWEDILYTLKN